MKIKRKLVKTLYICLGLLALYLICKIIEDKMKVKENYTEKQIENGGGDLDEMFDEQIKKIKKDTKAMTSFIEDVKKNQKTEKSKDIRKHPKWKKWKKAYFNFINIIEKYQEYDYMEYRDNLIFMDDEMAAAKKLEGLVEQEQSIATIKKILNGKNSKNKMSFGGDDDSVTKGFGNI